MSIAAVPKYIGIDFQHASPGMRFGLYLPIWTDRSDQEREVNKRAEARSREGQDVANILRGQGMDGAIAWLRNRRTRPLPGLWEKNDFAARTVWDTVSVLNEADRAAMKALHDRQRALTGTLGIDTLLCLEAHAVSPFTTGLGNEHPLENGFAFLNPYGLPYLPGSGIKGVLRQAARELASANWGETRGWSEEKRYRLLIGKETIPLSPVDALFGLESTEGDKMHVRGALTFWDVLPQIKDKRLMIEIMTPHQGHYYQWKKDHEGREIAVSPHDSGQPNPITFLTVPPGSSFTFYVQCDLIHLRRLASDLAENQNWKALLEAAFHHAFSWLGFGAKTSVGYGQFEMPSSKPLVIPEEREPAQRVCDDSLTKRLKMIKSAETFVDFIKSIEDHEKEALGKISFTGMESVINIGLVSALESVEASENIKKLIASKMLEVISPTKKWDDKKHEKFRKLQSLAGIGG